MNGFTLELHDATHAQRVDDVVSFVGEDASGSFGLQAGHARFMTMLSFGLGRFRLAGDGWQYVAVPGGVLYFESDRLWIGTRHFLVDTDYHRVSELLKQQMASEEQALHDTKLSLRRMEEELLRRLWQLGEAMD